MQQVAVHGVDLDELEPRPSVRGAGRPRTRRQWFQCRESRAKSDPVRRAGTERRLARQLANHPSSSRADGRPAAAPRRPRPRQSAVAARYRVAGHPHRQGLFGFTPHPVARRTHDTISISHSTLGGALVSSFGTWARGSGLGRTRMLRLVHWLARVAELIVTCPIRALRFLLATLVFDHGRGGSVKGLKPMACDKRHGPQAFLNPVPAIHGRARTGALAFAGGPSTKAGELMRVVAGSGRMRDLGSAEIDRHLETLARFIERLEKSGQVLGDASEASPVTMILRSAQSAPAQALISVTERLARVGASAKVVLAKLEPEEDLRQLFASLCRLGPCEPAQELVRWARNPRLLDAHEQVTYGTSMCWSGDAMRRDAERRNGLTQLDEVHTAGGAAWAARLRGAVGRLGHGARAAPAWTLHRAALGGLSACGQPGGGGLAAPTEPARLAARPALAALRVVTGLDPANLTP